MSQEEFEKLVSEAIDKIPEPYISKIDNVLFQVAEVPSLEQRRSAKLKPYNSLYGLYQGVPLTARNGTVHTIPPDVITIFMHPMIDILEGDELVKQVNKTVWHEVAHYFGLDHDRIHKIERKFYK